MPTVRDATHLDRDAIRRVHSLAFAGPEAEPVATLASALLDEASAPTALNLVAEVDGEAVAHVAFSPVSFSDGCKSVGCLLAPLGVKPEHQRRRIGTLLVQSGVRRLRAAGVDVLLVYGDPAYYGRFGFTATAAERFTPPYDLQEPLGWLALTLGASQPPERAVRVSCCEPLRNPALW